MAWTTGIMTDGGGGASSITKNNTSSGSSSNFLNTVSSMVKNAINSNPVTSSNVANYIASVKNNNASATPVSYSNDTWSDSSGGSGGSSYTPSYSSGGSSGGSSGSSGSSGSTATTEETTDLSDKYPYLANLAAAQAMMKQQEQAKADAEEQVKAYQEKLDEARATAIANANSALDTQGQASEAKYQTQLENLGNDYEELRRKSEVERYKNAIRQKEQLANQGRLDSGSGRMERLALQNNYSNNLNKINLQEAQERADIQNAITSLWADIGTQKAQNENSTLSSYADTLKSIMDLQSAYKYTPSTSDYYNAAMALANMNYGTDNPLVGDSNKELTYENLLNDLYKIYGYNV